MRKGILSATAAYVIWGLGPVYWKWVSHVPSSQLVAHRVFWCAVLLALLLTARRRWDEAAAVLRSRRVMLTLGATTVLIASNWLVYIYAVSTDRILQASLGYYINPLVTVLLGVVFLSERLHRARIAALVLAAAGVVLLTLRLGTVPWISLVLAFTFGFYGLLRKQVDAGPTVGLFAETAILSPFMVAWLVWAHREGTGAFLQQGVVMDLGLVTAGLITLVPLVLFTQGARLLPLAMVGFLQYLAPSLQFLLAVTVYGEPFSRVHLAAFLLIWTGLAVFTWDGWRRGRRRRLEGAA